MKFSLKTRKYIVLTGIFFTSAIAVYVFSSSQDKSEVSATVIQSNYLAESRRQFAELITNGYQQNSPVSEFLFQGQKVKVNYSTNESLKKYIDKVFQTYKPDYAAAAIINPKTGQILSLNSYFKNPSEQKKYGHLSMYAGLPSASIFKIITAAIAVDKHGYTADSILNYTGSNHTLYKRNLFSESTRWARWIDLKSAFAKSINTVFGRLSLKPIELSEFNDYSGRFGFNKNFKSDLLIPESYFSNSEKKDFELAALASGFNRETTLSPIHGAMIAASIIEKGIMRTPYIVDSLTTEEGQELFKSIPMVDSTTMTAKSSEQMQLMMEETIISGTSRKAFKNFNKSKKYRDILVGGKTGSITGNEPRGKVDWFVGYADDQEKSIAIAVVSVNPKHWVVKSSQVAEFIIKNYYSED
jgi:peptidoglycan glycosyltransferase